MSRRRRPATRCDESVFDPCPTAPGHLRHRPRPASAAMALGVIDRWLSLCVDYANDRVQRDSRRRVPASRRLARMEIAASSSRTWCPVHRGDRGIPPLSLAEASAVKVLARATTEVAIEAVQLFGGNGCMVEFGLEASRTTTPRPSRSYGGTDEMQITHRPGPCTAPDLRPAGTVPSLDTDDAGDMGSGPSGRGAHVTFLVSSAARSSRWRVMARWPPRTLQHQRAASSPRWTASSSERPRDVRGREGRPRASPPAPLVSMTGAGRLAGPYSR